MINNFLDNFGHIRQYKKMGIKRQQRKEELYTDTILCKTMPGHINNKNLTNMYKCDLMSMLFAVQFSYHRNKTGNKVINFMIFFQNTKIIKYK